MMPPVLTMPGVAECEAGVITRWFKQVGDRVRGGAPLVEITFSSAARPKLHLKETTNQLDSTERLVDPALTLLDDSLCRAPWRQLKRSTFGR